MKVRALNGFRMTRGFIEMLSYVSFFNYLVVKSLPREYAPKFSKYVFRKH